MAEARTVLSHLSVDLGPHPDIRRAHVGVGGRGDAALEHLLDPRHQVDVRAGLGHREHRLSQKQRY